MEAAIAAAMAPPTESVEDAVAKVVAKRAEEQAAQKQQADQVSLFWPFLEPGTVMCCPGMFGSFCSAVVTFIIN